MGMNTFGIFSSAIIAVVLSRPDHPSGHHHQVHHTQVHHSGLLHHSVHPVGHHSVHPAHHSAHPVVHHTTNQVHHSAPVAKSSQQTIAVLLRHVVPGAALQGKNI